MVVESNDEGVEKDGVIEESVVACVLDMDDVSVIVVAAEVGVNVEDNVKVDVVVVVIKSVVVAVVVIMVEVRDVKSGVGMEQNTITPATTPIMGTDSSVALESTINSPYHKLLQRMIEPFAVGKIPPMSARAGISSAEKTLSAIMSDVVSALLIDPATRSTNGFAAEVLRKKLFAASTNLTLPAAAKLRNTVATKQSTGVLS